MYRILLSLLLLSTPASLYGQGPGGAGGPPRGGPPGGPPGGRMGPSFDPLALEGPMQPAQFAEVTGATAEQRARYETMHDNYLAATRSERETVEYAMKRMREGIEGGASREEMFRVMQSLDGSAKLLEKQLKTFDGAVKDLLEKEQWKKYQDARKDQRKQLQERMPRPGGGPPGAGM
jgi:Spy/CpxP family protein refolding chaperone